MTARVAALVAMVAVGLACATGVAWAAFSSTTTSAATISADTDLRAPVVARSVIAKPEGGVPGYVKPNPGSYVTYAQVADDTASPSPSGMGTVALNGQGLSLAAGTYSIGGQSYNYKSATTTVPAGLANGTTVGYSLDVSDTAGNAATRSGYSVIIDGVAPTATDVQAANKTGGIAGRPEIGDTMTFTFSEPIDPQSVLAGWDGTSTPITVRVNNNASNDQVVLYNSANTATLPLGTVSLNSNVTAANITFGAATTRSTMVATGNTIVVTLGTQSAAATTGTAATMSWATSAGPYDRAANALAAATVSESGSPADLDF